MPLWKTDAAKPLDEASVWLSDLAKDQEDTKDTASRIQRDYFDKFRQLLWESIPSADEVSIAYHGWTQERNKADVLQLDNAVDRI